MYSAVYAQTGQVLVKKPLRLCGVTVNPVYADVAGLFDEFLQHFPRIAAASLLRVLPLNSHERSPLVPYD